ncbi:ATP-binding protein [Patescibacteria group bacterium]
MEEKKLKKIRKKEEKQEGLKGETKKRTEEFENTQAALMNILEDVEEARKKAEEEKNKTMAIIKNFSDGLLVFDKEKKLSFVNPKAVVFLGLKPAGIVGKTLAEISVLPEVAPLVGFFGEEIKELFRQEIVLRKNLVLEISTISIMVGGKKSGYIIVLHDITREKTVERLKTEFVSLAAHQLRTPLAAIKWTMKMLLDGDLGEITQEQRGLVEKTYISNERMISLINDLLDVTRIEEGRYLYKTTLTEIESIIQFIINSNKETAKRKNITLEFKRPEKKLPSISLDVEKIKLALQNFIDNAIKYTKRNGKIEISAIFLDSKEIEIAIKDTGVGIPQDQRDRVFTKFFRGANVLRMDTTGSGLGLFIAKNVIEAHGGKVRFESEEEKGTTFYFTLPYKERFEGFLGGI